MQFSFRQLVGWITLAGASIAISVALGPETSNPFFLFVDFVLAVILFLTGYAALDPWLGHPSYLQHKWPTRPDEHARTGPVTCGLTGVLPVAIGLPGYWLLVILLFAGPMDGPDPDAFTAEWFAGWLLIACFVAGTVVVGVSIVGLFALFRGAPLGPGFSRVFFLSASALVGAFLTIPIDWPAHQLAEIAGPIGAIGFLLLAAGWFLGSRYARKLIGFGRCARRWSARCLLVGGLLGCCVAALFSWIVPIGGVLGAVVSLSIPSTRTNTSKNPESRNSYPATRNPQCPTHSISLS